MLIIAIRALVKQMPERTETILSPTDDYSKTKKFLTADCTKIKNCFHVYFEARFLKRIVKQNIHKIVDFDRGITECYLRND